MEVEEEKSQIGDLSGVSELCMQPSIGEVVPGAISWTRVDLLVGMHDRLPPLSLSNPVAEVGDKLFQRHNLSFGRCVAVEVANETDAKGDVVEVVAGYVAAVNLPGPAAADFNLAVARPMAIADDKMVGQAVLHMPYAKMVDVKDSGITLASAAVVDDHVFPAALTHGGAVDRCAGR